MNRWLAVTFCLLFLVVDGALGDGTSGGSAITSADYSFAYWLNGWRRESAKDERPDILCLETSRYAFALNIADFSKAWFLKRTALEEASQPALKAPRQLIPAANSRWFNRLGPPVEEWVRSEWAWPAAF